MTADAIRRKVGVITDWLLGAGMLFALVLLSLIVYYVWSGEWLPAVFMLLARGRVSDWLDKVYERRAKLATTGAPIEDEDEKKTR